MLMHYLCLATEVTAKPTIFVWVLHHNKCNNYNSKVQPPPLLPSADDIAPVDREVSDLQDIQ
jgi:hypothetical protein